MFPGLKRSTRDSAGSEETDESVPVHIPDSLSMLNQQQRAAFDAVVAGKSVFITGPGGTGKSFLLQNLYAHYKGYTGKKIAITALTGCAAILIGSFAKTLHSWAGIGLGRGEVDVLAAEIARDKRKGPRWRKTDCLVIDEVSMMTPALLELLDAVGKAARKSTKPFGGMQIVLVGDFYQLPPVSSRNFAFESPLWTFESIQLTEIIRQKDVAFQEILNQARIGELTDASLEILESRKTDEWKRQEIKPTLLFTRNTDVNAINDNKLKKLEGEEKVFEAKTSSKVGMRADILQMLVDKLDRDAPYEVELRLKVGAQVMLLKQLYEEKIIEKIGSKKGEEKDSKISTPVHGLVNGSRGIVLDFAADGNPIVKFLSGRTVTVRPATWELEEVTREQIPLRVAYAVTIHKAQGASLDSALVDVGTNTFEYGQAYVALSRARSLDALFIYQVSKSAFRAHPAVKAFYAGIKN